MTDKNAGTTRVIAAHIATADAVARFGTLIGAATGATPIMQFEGVDVYGGIPFRLDGTPELIVCNLPRRPFQVGLMERHFRHTQTYLPLNGKAFVMVVGPPGHDDMPALDGLQAFLFRDGCGIALAEGVWHEFPMAIEDDTAIAVILTAEAHKNTDPAPATPDDAEGPDLQRRSFLYRGLDVTVTLAPTA